MKIPTAERLQRDFVATMERAMKERGTSRAELARQLGFSRAYVTQTLRPGADNPSLETIAKFSDALGVHLVLTRR